MNSSCWSHASSATAPTCSSCTAVDGWEERTRPRGDPGHRFSRRQMSKASASGSSETAAPSRDVAENRDSRLLAGSSLLAMTREPRSLDPRDPEAIHQGFGGAEEHNGEFANPSRSLPTRSPTAPNPNCSATAASRENPIWGITVLLRRYFRLNSQTECRFRARHRPASASWPGLTRHQ